MVADRVGPEPSRVRFIAWGELLWDLFPDGARLGGAPANAAYHAACFGAQASLVSRVGDDELGARALRELSALGVDVQAVQRDPNAPTGTVTVELANGEPRYQIAEGVAWDELSWSDELGAAFAEADVICFGTLAQRGAKGFDVLARALSHAQEAAIRLCDLNLRAPFASRSTVDRALELANAVKLNEAELVTLSGWFDKPDVTAWLLNERGVKLVAVTRGARGAALTTLTEALAEPAEPLSSADGDAVGAGDAFGAALSVSLARGLPRVECLQLANRYAAHVASQPGAMPAPPSWLSSRRAPNAART